MKKSNTPPEEQQSLYAEHKTIHPRIVLGYFTRLKALSGVILLSIYYITPWLQWDGNQAILFDMPARKFHILGLTFWPQDFIYLSFLLIIAAVTLFLFTALAGRLWCGFACPQTIWTDAFLWMERLVEGDRAKQIKLDNTPLSFRKIRIKATKHTLWLVFALFTGFTFVGFFTPIRELSQGILTFNLGEWETFWLFFYSFATYGNAGWLREQVCIYMCPYARFQSAMFDKDTMIIAYDEKRGEARGTRKRDNKDYKNKGLGDCIDCTMCVQVCPTGIDIRNGLQYQCISCSACVDVCDEIMDKMDYPKGLIRYTTENSLNGIPTHIVRPRLFVYGGILLAIFIGMGYAISTRSLVQLDVIRDRSRLFIETDAGLIENVYRLRIMNKDKHPHVYDIAATGIEGLKFAKEHKIEVESGDVITLPVRLAANPDKLVKRSTKVNFKLTAQDNPALTITEEGRFLGPLRR
ncbi:(Fe-S)-binding protein [Candidatus Thiomargarita nelsonii]|uniref:(Fe-S)-binding protein n=1 Tax=Candidatus Thiomargarita nelsonii TaxID=1003181 RepID=A0A4E0QV46_9GAMM|nr:(Fe-S)-binding protein [Candidatus Thiomargarita nelsonii]